MELGKSQEPPFLKVNVATAYRIVLAHQNLDPFAQKVKDAVIDAARILSGSSKLLEFSTELSEAHIPQVVAYLASDEGQQDDVVAKVVDSAIGRDVSILPIIDANQSNEIGRQLPESIAHLNAALWSGKGTNVAASLLAALGLVERERKVFISYRRSETSELATQLHTELVQRRFDVFLDRFSVEPGENFQRRLDEDLSDKAFVLLLESSNLGQSQWVRHEVSYAQARRIEMLALTLPNTDRQRLVPSIDDAFRLWLHADDISSDGTLSAGALAETLDAIELAHARALRRRREQILGSVTEKLRMDGCTCSPTDDWCVLASGPTGQLGLFWVTPRRPEPRDFHSLSRQYERVKQRPGVNGLRTSVVHGAGRLADEHQELLDWLSRISGRGLATIGTCSV